LLLSLPIVTAKYYRYAWLMSLLSQADKPSSLVKSVNVVYLITWQTCPEADNPA
jgi:hypothetical protein